MEYLVLAVVAIVVIIGVIVFTQQTVHNAGQAAGTQTGGSQTGGGQAPGGLYCYTYSQDPRCQDVLANLPASRTATDSDGSVFISGSITGLTIKETTLGYNGETGKLGTHTDYCDGNTLYEGFVDTNKCVFYIVEVDCAEYGGTCSNGVCQGGNPPGAPGGTPIVEQTTCSIQATPTGAAISLAELGSLVGASSPSLRLESGWNLISIPNSNGRTFQQVFGDASNDILTIYSWDANNHVYFRGYTTNVIDPALGYWVYYFSDTPVQIDPGALGSPPELNLSAGWNLVGANSMDLSALQSTYNIEPPVWAYVKTNSSEYYDLASALLPYRGYWVYVNPDLGNDSNETTGNCTRDIITDLVEAISSAEASSPYLTDVLCMDNGTTVSQHDLLSRLSEVASLQFMCSEKVCLYDCESVPGECRPIGDITVSLDSIIAMEYIQFKALVTCEPYTGMTYHCTIQLVDSLLPPQSEECVYTDGYDDYLRGYAYLYSPYIMVAPLGVNETVTYTQPNSTYSVGLTLSSFIFDDLGYLRGAYLLVEYPDERIGGLNLYLEDGFVETLYSSIEVSFISQESSPVTGDVSAVIALLDKTPQVAGNETPEDLHFETDYCSGSVPMNVLCEDNAITYRPGYLCKFGCYEGACLPVPPETLFRQLPHSMAEWESIDYSKITFEYDCEESDYKAQLIDEGAITYYVFTDDIPMSNIYGPSGEIIETSYMGKITLGGSEYYVDDLDDDSITIVCGDEATVTAPNAITYRPPAQGSACDAADGAEVYSIKVIDALIVDGQVIDVTLQVTHGGFTEEVTTGVSGTPFVGDIKIHLKGGTGSVNPTTGVMSVSADLLVWYIPSEYTFYSESSSEDNDGLYDSQGRAVEDADLDNVDYAWRLWFSNGDGTLAQDLGPDGANLEGRHLVEEYPEFNQDINNISLPAGVTEVQHWSSYYANASSSPKVLRYMAFVLEMGDDIPFEDVQPIRLPFYDAKYLLNDQNYLSYQGLKTSDMKTWETVDKQTFKVSVTPAEVFNDTLDALQEFRTAVTIDFVDANGNSWTEVRVDEGPFQGDETLLYGSTIMQLRDIDYDDDNNVWEARYVTWSGTQWSDAGVGSESVVSLTPNSKNLLVDSQVQDIRITTEYSSNSGWPSGSTWYIDEGEGSAIHTSQARMYIDVARDGVIDLVSGFRMVNPNPNVLGSHENGTDTLRFVDQGDTYIIVDLEDSDLTWTGSGWTAESPKEAEVFVTGFFPEYTCNLDNEDCDEIATGEIDGQLVSLGGARITVVGDSDIEEPAGSGNDQEADTVSSVTLVLPKSSLMPTISYLGTRKQLPMTCDIYQSDDEAMSMCTTTACQTDTDCLVGQCGSRCVGATSVGGVVIPGHCEV